MENNFFQKNPLQDLLSSLNAVISTNESTRFITGHMGKIQTRTFIRTGRLIETIEQEEEKLLHKCIYRELYGTKRTRAILL